MCKGFECVSINIITIQYNLYYYNTIHFILLQYNAIYIITFQYTLYYLIFYDIIVTAHIIIFIANMGKLRGKNVHEHVETIRPMLSTARKCFWAITR